VVVIRAFDHTNETEVNSILLDRNLILAQVQDLQDAGATVPASDHERIVSFMVNRIEAEVEGELTKVLISKRPADCYSSLECPFGAVPSGSENIGLGTPWSLS